MRQQPGESERSLHLVCAAVLLASCHSHARSVSGVSSVDLSPDHVTAANSEIIVTVVPAPTKVSVPIDRDLTVGNAAELYFRMEQQKRSGLSAPAIGGVTLRSSRPSEP